MRGQPSSWACNLVSLCAQSLGTSGKRGQAKGEPQSVRLALTVGSRFDRDSTPRDASSFKASRIQDPVHTAAIGNARHRKCLRNSFTNCVFLCAHEMFQTQRHGEGGSRKVGDGTDAPRIGVSVKYFIPSYLSFSARLLLPGSHRQILRSRYTARTYIDLFSQRVNMLKCYCSYLDISLAEEKQVSIVFVLLCDW